MNFQPYILKSKFRNNTENQLVAGAGYRQYIVVAAQQSQRSSVEFKHASNPYVFLDASRCAKLSPTLEGAEDGQAQRPRIRLARNPLVTASTPL